MQIDQLLHQVSIRAARLAHVRAVLGPSTSAALSSLGLIVFALLLILVLFPAALVAAGPSAGGRRDDSSHDRPS